MDVVTIDFETYYDRDYSLSKMTTEAYLRDPRFEIIGVAVKVNQHPTDFYTGQKPGSFLHSLDYSNKAILAHNTVFDGAILRWMFGIRPRVWLDTASMARPKYGMTTGVSLAALVKELNLGVKGDEVVRAIGKRRSHFSDTEMNAYAAYCCKDVDLTYKLYRHLLRQGFPLSELQTIHNTLSMFIEPRLTLDTELLEDHLEQVQQNKSSLVKSIGLDSMTEEEVKSLLQSSARFVEFLTSWGVEVPQKRNAKGMWIYDLSKTSLAFTKLLEHEEPAVANAVAARLGVRSTLEETRTQSMLGIAARGALPVLLNYYGAHTGRFSGGDKMNLQNLPRKGTLRKAICAPPGHLLVAGDLSQIEARIVAWVSGQKDLVQAFADKEDVYCRFASRIYGRAITKADATERFVGKVCVLGLGYGMGGSKFHMTLASGAAGMRLAMEPDEANKIVALYRTTAPAIPRFWQRCGNALRVMVSGGASYDLSQALPSLQATSEGITLPNKMMIRYPLLVETSNGFSYCPNSRAYRTARNDPHKHLDLFTRIYGGKVTENIVQALARIVITEHMNTLSGRYRVVLQVHDELVLLCKENEAEEAAAYMTEVMTTAPAWAPDLPVACEVGVGANYGEVKG